MYKVRRKGQWMKGDRYEINQGNNIGKLNEENERDKEPSEL